MDGHAPSGSQFESSNDVADGSLTFSNEEEEEDNGRVSLGYDGEEEEPESKRRLNNLFCQSGLCIVSSFCCKCGCCLIVTERWKRM